MPKLVALDLPGGQQFVDELRRAWDAGDAVFPLDRRLPPVARATVLEAIAPDRLVDDFGTHRLSGPGVESGDALVVATSGTTGSPRGVVLTHEAVTASAQATSTRIGVTAEDHWLACLPLSHIGGLAVVTRAVLSSTRLTVHDGFDAGRVAAAAAAGATLVSLVATALQRIDAAAFRRIVLGGARPPSALPSNVITTYGMTETGSGVVYDGVPLDGVDVRVDERGEIHLRGSMLLRCYRDGTVPLIDGWFATGDLGEIDADGRLVVHGRRDELIITGGENVWPSVVEAVIRGIDGVVDVAVMGVADPEWGQRVVAWVVPDHADDPPTLERVRRYVGETLPSFMAPKELHLIDRLPRTTSGKVVRRALPC